VSAASTVSHGRSAPDACSVGFDRADVCAYGTAAQATFFLAVEQPGPWGRDAARESHLPAGLGDTLSSACAERGGRLSLLRRPGRHADEHQQPPHTVYAAWSGPEPWLLSTVVPDVAVLTALDVDALARGDEAAVAATLPGAAPAAPVLLVCTNGRRDVCCAVRGRPVALEAAAVRPNRVWEASHTGGHRFAPTGVLLPHGATFARLDARRCAEALDSAERGMMPASLLGPAHDRGRSPLPAAAQAAESHVRQVTGERSLTALSTVPWRAAPDTAGEATTQYRVQHADGREWQVRCRQREVTALPESCGKGALPVLEWTVESDER
jgi:hypothetical protein